MTTVIKNVLLYPNFLKNPQITKIRLCSSIIEKVEDLEAPSVVYTSTSNEYKMGKKQAVAKLQELFKLSPNEAIETAMRFKKLYEVMSKTITTNYDLLKKTHNVQDEQILKYLDILAETELHEKIQQLERFKVSDILPLLLMSKDEIAQFVVYNFNGETNVSGGRVAYLATLFNISVYEVNEALFRRPFLRTLSLEKIKEKIQLLLSLGITMEEINNDYWVLQYNPKVIQERIQFARDCNVDKVKTWMVRAPVDILNKYVQRRCDNKQILGEATLAEYLSKRLECTIEVATSILIKHPALLHKHMTKLKEIIDFLYAENFTPSHIIKNPKILMHSTETTAKRLKQIKELDLKLDSLYILTKSKRQYLHHYENLLKAKGKIKENLT